MFAGAYNKYYIYEIADIVYFWLFTITRAYSMYYQSINPLSGERNLLVGADKKMYNICPVGNQNLLYYYLIQYILLLFYAISLYWSYNISVIVMYTE